MEPVTTMAVIKLLAHWGGKAFDKVFDTSVSEVSKESVKWLKSLFFKDDKPKEVLEKYQEKPESPARQNAVKAIIETELEDNPQAQEYLLELVKVIQERTGGNIAISDSENINSGINHGHIGDSAAMSFGYAGIVVSGTGNTLIEPQSVFNYQSRDAGHQWPFKINDLEKEIDRLQNIGIDFIKEVNVCDIQNTNGKKFIPFVKKVLENAGFRMHNSDSRTVIADSNAQPSTSYIGYKNHQIGIFLNDE